MKVRLENSEYIDVEKIKSKEDILKATRLFYELGEFMDFNRRTGQWFNWERSGVFKEIFDLDSDRLFFCVEKERESEYIAHHNFVYC